MGDATLRGEIVLGKVVKTVLQIKNQRQGKSLDEAQENIFLLLRKDNRKAPRVRLTHGNTSRIDSEPKPKRNLGRCVSRPYYSGKTETDQTPTRHQWKAPVKGASRTLILWKVF